LHERIEEDELISYYQKVELVRYCENNMSVRYIKHVPFDLLGPSDGVVPATSWTESVFTVVIYFGCLPTIGAGIDVYAKSCSPACTYILNSFVLFWLNEMFWVFAVLIPPGVKESSKAIFFFTKPVMLLRCMNSTFTHAAIVFDPSLSVLPH
jgi:hypothetical protein